MRAYAALAVLVLTACAKIRTNARSRRMANEVIGKARRTSKTMSLMYQQTPTEDGIRKVLITLYKCGTLSCAEIGRIISDAEYRTTWEFYFTGEKTRDELLNLGYINPSEFGNRDFRHRLTTLGLKVARGHLEIE